MPKLHWGPDCDVIYHYNIMSFNLTISLGAYCGPGRGQKKKINSSAQIHHHSNIKDVAEANIDNLAWEEDK